MDERTSPHIKSEWLLGSQERHPNKNWILTSKKVHEFLKKGILYGFLQFLIVRCELSEYWKRKKGPLSYNVKMEDSETIRKHADQLKSSKNHCPRWEIRKPVRYQEWSHTALIPFFFSKIIVWFFFFPKGQCGLEYDTEKTQKSTLLFCDLVLLVLDF